MSGFVHLIVPAQRFTLLAGGDALVDYRFNTGAAVHRFCGHCGVKSFYIPRSHPDGIDVNVRCLDPGTIASCHVERVRRRRSRRRHRGHRPPVASTSGPERD